MWLFLRELRVGTGHRNGGAQRLDAFALNCLPHLGMKRVCYEVKVARGDFLCEVKHPLKRRIGMRYSNEFYFVTPPGLMELSEVPVDCGLIECGRATLEEWKQLIKRQAGFFHFDPEKKTFCLMAVPAPWRETPGPTWQLVAAMLRNQRRRFEEAPPPSRSSSRSSPLNEAPLDAADHSSAGHDDAGDFLVARAGEVGELHEGANGAARSREGGVPDGVGRAVVAFEDTEPHAGGEHRSNGSTPGEHAVMARVVERVLRDDAGERGAAAGEAGVADGELLGAAGAHIDGRFGAGEGELLDVRRAVDAVGAALKHNRSNLYRGGGRQWRRRGRGSGDASRRRPRR